MRTLGKVAAYAVVNAALGLAVAVMILACLTTYGVVETPARVEAAAAASKAPSKPCKYEDSRNCVWDARHMGNGVGRSFIARKDGTVKYVSHRRAHRLLFG